MIAKFSRMLSACAALGLLSVATPADAGSHGHALPGYHGRAAGPVFLPVPGIHAQNVNVHRGGSFNAHTHRLRRSDESEGVTVYRGGHILVQAPKPVEYIAALDVLVFRGAGRSADHADVIVTRGLSLNGGVGYAPY